MTFDVVLTPFNSCLPVYYHLFYYHLQLENIEEKIASKLPYTQTSEVSLDKNLSLYINLGKGKESINLL